MPFIQNFQPADKPENTPDSTTPGLPPLQSVEDALEQIDRILHQMLLLAELSASDAKVERDKLQKVLERLQNRIDQIADTINS